MQINSIKTINRLNNTLLVLFSFLVGFGGVKLPIASVALILGWLIDVILNRKTLINDRKSFFWLYLPIALIFVLSVISLTYSDPIFGAKVLERRILLLFIPIAGYIGISKRIDFHLILKSFVYGVSIAMLWILLQMVIDNFRLQYVGILIRQDILNVFMDYIRQLQHRTYLGINIAISMVLLYGYFNLSRFKLWIPLFVMAFFVLLSGARATSLTVLALLFFFIIHTNYSKVSKRILFSLFGLAVAAFIAFVLYYPRMLDALLNGAGEDDSRITIWLSTLHTLNSNWLYGYGLGDFYPALIEQYKINGATHAALYGLDPHNQYLYLVGEIGVVGLMAILVVFAGFIKVSPKDQRFTASVFVFVFAFNFLFESILLRLWGVASFVIVFLLYRFAVLSTTSERHQFVSDRTINLNPILITCGLLFVVLFGIFQQKIVFNEKDPYTYAQTEFEAIVDLPGVLPVDLPENSIGYKLNSNATSVPSLPFVHRTKIGQVESHSCDSVIFQAFCFVSNDFSGKEVFAGGYTKDYGAKSYYDISKKGSWQKLEIRTTCPTKKVSYYLQFAEAENKRITDLKGYVIFVNPLLKQIQ